MEVEGDVFSEDYMMMKLRLEKMEDEVGDWTETIDYPNRHLGSGEVQQHTKNSQLARTTSS